MTETPWITIVGLGEDGPDGLAPASLAALRSAEIIMGPPRHLALLPDVPAKRIEWPVPFADGLDILEEFSGRPVVVLASGDPFWFGAGTVLANRFGREALRVFPGPSTFSRAAARMGWALEKTVCLGLHAAPLARMRPYLHNGAHLLVTLRDGAAVAQLCDYLADTGFGTSVVTVMEALGGPSERVTEMQADTPSGDPWSHPVCAAIAVSGSGAVVPSCSGLPDALFETDGVMTKRAVRAMTLSALAPCPGEVLWDIGGGSGSVAVEWLLAHNRCDAFTIEPRADRIALIRANAAALGAERLNVIEGTAPEALSGLPVPDAVFIGGGLTAALLEALKELLPSGTRLVANAVTMEAEALLVGLHAEKGGDLLRLELSSAKALGTKRGWDTAYPVVQWSGRL
ncbi:precorrin-6y C5,15-methyltransferase (decarboxylating) subunit CbiE [Roseobacter sp. S98]|uniref:precorrin-6y C5,15-methyltransferase (decarboxylating) subunit CbiE n=1 Tax=Roseobacter algicola (ex Choi et al. 2025) (nom. illeg.) TaxID=3092138 RepID=UPI0035C734CE